MALIGYDLSHWEYPECPEKWNGPADYAMAQAGGIRFAHFKVSHGMKQDIKYHKNGKQTECYPGFTAAPLPFPFGGFHWYLELGERKARDQALFYWDELGSTQLQPCVDMEIENESYPNLRIFRDTIQKLSNRRLMVYSSVRYWRDPSKDWADLCDLWVADYRWWWPFPRVPKPWKTWVLWQYTANGPAQKLGIRENLSVDMSKFNGDETAFAAWVGGPIVPKPVPAPEPPKPLRVRLWDKRNVRVDHSAGAALSGFIFPGDYDASQRWDNGPGESWAQIGKYWANVIINGNAHGEWL